MSHDDAKRLAASVVHFLGEQVRGTMLSSDNKESLEVAIQCLENAFGISSSDAHLLPRRSLLDIFVDATRSEPMPTVGEASEADKHEAEALKNDGNNLMKSELYEEALRSYTRAIQLDGKNAVYYCNRAAAYSKLNNHTFALEDCERAIQIDPNYSKAYGRMGLAFASMNDHKQAKECYEKALELDPSNESYRNNLQIAEEKCQEQLRSDPFNRMFGPFLQNPAIMNMAERLMTGDSNSLQSLFGQMMGGAGTSGAQSTQEQQQQPTDEADSGNPPDIMQFLRAGQQLAQQIQQSNPELIEQVRREFGTLYNTENQTDQNPDEHEHGTQ